MPQISRRSRVVILALVVALVASLFAPGLSGVAGAAPPPPDNLSPNGGSFTANPSLTWDQVLSADEYRVFVCLADPCTSSNDVWTIITVNTTATPPNDLPTGTLHWTVESRDASGFSAPEKASFTKSQSGPILQSPPDNATLQFPDDPPTFTWQAQQGARSYLLEIDDENGFINPTRIVTDNPSHTLTSTQTLNQEFFWRVRSSSSTNPNSGSAILSDWSATQSYTVAWPNPTPMLMAPPNTTAPGSAITDIELVWNPVPGAASYRLQVNRNIDFSGQFVENREVFSTHYSPLETYDNGSYHWRVAPIDAAGNEGDFSETFSFSRDWTDEPALSSPADGELSLNPLRFSWSPVEHAAYYEVQVSTDDNFSPGETANCYTNHTLLNPYTMFDGPSGAPAGCAGSFWDFGHGQTYFWRVRGIDADADILGFYSPVRSFIRQLPIPTRTAPANGATVATPVLTWNKVVGAQQYLVTIIDDEGNEVVEDEPTWATTYTPHKKLDPEVGPFRWYVRTRSDDGDGVIPSLGSASVFDVPDAPTFGPQPEMLTPANASSHRQMPSMTWTAVEEATEYEIWYSVVGSGIEAKLDTPKIENAGFTSVESPLPNGSYDMYVRAYDGNTLISFGDDRRINIIDLQTVTQTAPPDCPPPGGGCQQVTQMPEMAWNDLTDARFYLVYLAFDPNFTNIIKVYEVPQLSMIPREELPDNDAGQAYYWHVRPCKARDPYRCGPDPQGVASPPERAFQKRSDPVELIGPAWNSNVANQPRFSWTDYLESNSSDLEAAEYRIQVATNPAFTSPIDDKRVDQPFYTPYDRTYPEGPIYWRVRAVDASGNELTWSVPSMAEQGMFNKASGFPTMVTPGSNQNVNGQPTFSWQSQPFAESYVLEVYKNGDDPLAPGNRVINASTDHTQFTPSAPLPTQAPGVPYAWRIRREDGQGKDGAWSDIRKFTITEVAPTLTAPAQNATVTNDRFVFTWTSVPRAATYRLQSSDDGFNSFEENQQTVMTAWAPDDAYDPGPWSWRVQALDANDQVIGTSNVRNFTRINQGEAPSDVRVTNGRGTATVRWDPPAQMPNPPYNQYRVTLTGGPTGPLTTTVSSNIFSAAFNGLINGQAYDVKVVGVASGTPGPENSNVVTALPNGCVGTPFNDVPAAGQGGYPFCPDIAWLSTTGITQGTVLPNGTVLYKPGDGVSRMAMAAFLYRFAGSPPENGPRRFADVAPGHPFYKEINWMWVSGNSTGTPNPGGGLPLYKPNDGVSREAMGAFLWRFAGTPAVPGGSPQFFADVNSSHPFYQGIQWMFFSGISTGTANPPGKPLYKPTNVVTREAMAAFLHRLDGVLT